MKILILGGNGMLGHRFLCSWRDRHDVKVTLRTSIGAYGKTSIFTTDNSYEDVDVRNNMRLEAIIRDFRPDAVVNAVGITKQRTDESTIIPAIEVNALFPHCLAELCHRYGVRMVHMSTDCIFSGGSGLYDEQANSDAKDLYGRSKFLGEVSQSHVITLRKSTIGLELAGAHGLVEWFLAQRGKIQGFRRAIYSGLTSSELARVIENILINHYTLSGIWNIASAPINKYDLLMQLAAKLGRNDIEIEPSDSFVCDRSLNGAKFCRQTGYVPPSWNAMITELADEIKDRDGVHV